MHASNSLTLPRLLSLYIDFLRGEVGGLFYGLGRAILKEGVEELGGTRVLGSPRRRNNNQQRALSNIPLAAVGAVGQLPALS